MGYMALSGAGGLSKEELEHISNPDETERCLCPNYKGASGSSFDVVCRPDLRGNKAHAAKLHGKVDSDASPFLASSVHINELCYHSEECISFRLSEEVG